MALLKRNIWLLFYVFLCLGLFSLTYNIYRINTDITNKYKLEQENITKITANSMNSLFLQYEMILDILSTEITRDEHLITKEKIIEVYDNILKLNSSIVLLGLANKEGEIYIRDSIYKNIKFENLLENNKTKKSFKRTLNSNNMLIGRTYFNKSIGRFIVPVRKAIKDKNGVLLGVITCGIDLEKGFDFFLNNREISSNYETFLFRDSDYYFQIAPKKNSLSANVYDYQVEKERVEDSIKHTENIYGISINEIKEKEQIITVKSNDGREVLSTSKYLSKFELWLTTQIPISVINNKIYTSIFFVCAIFAITFFTLYLLFKYIAQSEKKKKAALYYQANHDYLTNLYNRQYLSVNFEKEFQSKTYSLFFIDIDNFKYINDNFGHDYGDVLLKTISTRLLSLKTLDDIIIRYSGDEFLFITQETNKKALKTLAKKILEKLSEAYFINQYKLNITASVGISIYPQDGSNFDEIKRAADMAMYLAKDKKNSFNFYKNSLKSKYHEKNLLEEKLKLSLENKEIYLVYQPQIDIQGKLYGVEALVRWENPELGFVPPDKFIKIAEDIGFINELGKFIIKEALKDIKKIQEKTKSEFKLSINISLDQFLEKNFFSDFIYYTSEARFDNSLITLELTENIFIEDINKVLEILNNLKAHNIKISLDDFGTGYSSLSLLKQLPIDELKIDKSFIDDILVSKSSKNVIKSVIAIGKEFNMNILCEGIESKQQRDRLVILSCDLFQGYYYSKPLKKEALIEYIKTKA